MAKKINVELDINVSGLGCKKQIAFSKETSKEAKELSKVFSGEDFKF